MFSKYRILISASIISLLFIIIAGASLSCVKISVKSPSDSNFGSVSDTDSYVKAPPPPPAVKGTITTGTDVVIESKTISSSGGRISVNKPGDSMDGFEISVPANSYNSNKKFDISYAPVTGHTFGKYFKPLTPLIKIENGGGYSNELITLKIPVNIQPGKFAMPFLFNSSTGEIQGMPIVKVEQGFITVATRHFSDAVVTEVDFSDPALKDTKWDTGFLPGKDDWQFPNARSFIAQDGLCNGMSLSAMWYYIRKPDGNKNLSYAYDNNGNSPATKDFWMDDSLAYRYSSVIMDDYYWDAYENKYFRNLDSVDDRATWRATVSAIINTKAPQLLAVRKSDAIYGHALVAYSAIIAGPDEGTLCVSDPNLFGDPDRKITYSNGKFAPYDTALATGDPGVLLDKVLYIGKDTLVDYVDCESRWKEFKDKTIGSHPSTGHPQFPKYTMVLTNSKKETKEIKDSTTANDKLFRITAEKSSETLGTKVYRDGVQLQTNKDKFYELLPGKNHIGVYIAGKGSGDQFYYVDFQYVDISLCDLTLEPVKLDGKTGEPYTFSAKSSPGAKKLQYDWYINDKKVQSGEKTSIQPTFNKAGTYTVKATLFEDGKEVCSAICTANIKEDKNQTPTTAAPSSPGGSTSGTFPDSPFNGMQITYTISGASITGHEDAEGMTVSRTFKGKMASSGNLSVSGSAKMGNGFSADLVVTVTVDGQSKTFKKNIKSGFPGFNSESFDLSVPIPRNAKGGKVSIEMTGHYNAGERWLSVSGNF